MDDREPKPLIHCRECWERIDGPHDADCWTGAQLADLARLQARVAVLESALAPFAIMADVADPVNTSWAITTGGKLYRITYKHLEQARAALPDAGGAR